VLIVGGGIAGLSAALSIDSRIQVTIVTKTNVKTSNTYDAQGGIAVSVGEDDSLEHHLNDTLKAGCGLCDEEVVRQIVEGSHEALKRLVGWGAKFDCEDKKYQLGLEGGHSRHRVLHAEGARTGREILRSLLQTVLQRDNVQILENHFVVELLSDSHKIVGALVQSDAKKLMIFRSENILLATGGLGQVYRETSNPSVATGDGVALAQRAGAALMDMEFVQFHPTTLYIAGAARILISEAVRGAGGLLVDKYGRRFMCGRHELAELAPRDVVSRVVLETIKETQDTQVYLDVRHMTDFAEKFPSLHRVCLEFGIDSSKAVIPVCPSAHYHVGGIKTDMQGKTNVEGLLAAGECAAIGLHGANRLASNSLLEGLVMGHEVSEVLNSRSYSNRMGPVAMPSMGKRDFYMDLEDMRRSLRFLMWRQVGIVRSKEGLQLAQDRVKVWRDVLVNRKMNEVSQWELFNMVQVSTFIIDSALQREESRGVHFRSDFPETHGEWKRHIEND